MLAPNRTRWRKQQRGRNRGTAWRGGEVSFGSFGLQAIVPGFLTSRQIEAARVAMTRHVKRGGKIWIRVFPHHPMTKKPLETRQGKGKAPVEYWMAKIKPGTVMYEIDGVPEEDAREAFRLAAHKIPFKTRFLKKGEISL
ncbi:MAG: 50S ribosomal protein L16 [Myxococcales bacterium]|nr:50S ribosomal protein L16 [Myxococcales bacterium]